MTNVSIEIIKKIEHFCAYQERCKFDVERKLNSFNLSVAQISEIITFLENEKFIDEDRYVETFVRSKVKRSWGKQKIISALKTKHISQNIIDKYVKDIDSDNYNNQLKYIIQKWLKTHKDSVNKREKLFRFLISKGYSYEEILRAIASN